MVRHDGGEQMSCHLGRTNGQLAAISFPLHTEAAMEDGTDKPPRADFRAAPGRSGTLEPPFAKNEPVATGEEMPSAIPYKVLMRKHRTYDAGYWAECKALYAGGRELLRNPELLGRLFPQHLREADIVYSERLRRAYYVCYAGEIVDHIVAGLSTSPIEMMSESESVDPYYQEFLEDASGGQGKRQTFHQLMREQILTALLCRTAWTQVDLPVLGAEFESLGDQERAGALNAYALGIDPESVYDWEESPADELRWVKICTVANERPFVNSSTNVLRRVWTVYTPEQWARYEVTYAADKPPKEETPIPLVAEGMHSFDQVPLLRLELPDGLWAMNKLCAIAKEHFNKRCALSWAEYKSLFQERYEFLAPPDSMAIGPAIADDDDRALNQTHGQGHTQLRIDRDRVEFVGPDSAPFEVALKSLADLRDEMHRVTHQMALTFDNRTAGVARSGESKKQDKSAHATVLLGLGEMVREHAEDVLAAITTGRQDEHEWTASGMNRFDTSDISDMVDDAEKLEVIDIPSPTFQRRHKYMLSKTALGDEASEKDLEAIESELEDAYTPEQMEAEREARREAENGRRGFSSRPEPADDDDEDDD